MSPLAKRIKERLDDLGLKVRPASEAAGLGASGIRNILEGRSKNPRGDSLVKLARILKTSVEWLTTGRGVKHVEPEDQAPAEGAAAVVAQVGGRRVAQHVKPGSIPEFDVRAMGGYGGGFSEPASVYDNEGRSYSGDVVRAEWVFPEHYLRDELRVKLSLADIVAVDGPSMDDGSVHSLRSGDRVVINRGDTDCRQGAIFAVWDGGGVIIKQVELVRGADPPRIRCSSLNPSYQPFEVTLDENAHIIGRVICKIARM